MTDDTEMDDRLRKLAEDTDDDMYAQTIVIDDDDIMGTKEMRQLLYPDDESE